MFHKQKCVGWRDTGQLFGLDGNPKATSTGKNSRDFN
jgi:hypothetical protein